MSGPTSIELRCPAKVNLALSVSAPTTGGMHPIASWMVAVDLVDSLTLSRRDDGRSTFDIAFADDADCPCRGMRVDWPLESDLAVRAHGALERHVGRALPTSVRLRKSIVAGGGLGGGSSDAAGVLVGLRRLFELEIDDAELRRVGMTLGSDVGFAVGALTGWPSAIVTGLGEQVAPAARSQVIHLVLVFPPFGCATGKVYQAFDELIRSSGRAGIAPDAAAVRRLAAMAKLPADGPFNDLAGPACAVEPRLHELRQRVAAVAGLPVHVSGSGSTLFVVTADGEAAAALAASITRQTHLSAVATRTV